MPGHELELEALKSHLATGSNRFSEGWDDLEALLEAKTQDYYNSMDCGESKLCFFPYNRVNMI